ncbi:MAG: cytoplasmic protein [Desulfobacterales bacterium]|nr:MAG: cytoplasmic protein [Desulfobacterales bacterium]
MAEEQKNSVDFKVDRSNLYREESFTDLKVGSIKRLTPVKPDGSVDKSRKEIFVGHTNIITPQGPLPIQGLIQAKELQQAIKRFPEAMEAAMDRLIEEAKKFQEKEKARIAKPESRIIVPGR